jgi:hypothetical protein
MEQSTFDFGTEPPVKLCECGCGQPAPIATKTDKKWGHVQGQPQRFVKGHIGRGRIGVWQPSPEPPPVHLCECGCGQPTPIAKRNNKRNGHVRGQPTRFIRGHTDKPNGGRTPKYPVEVGQRIGLGVVLEVGVIIPRQGVNHRGVRLLCDCGNEFLRLPSALFRVATPNCGECWNRSGRSRFIDRTGKRYGKLLVIRRAEKGPRRGVWWVCMCDCGNPEPFIANSSALGSGHTRSCGCLQWVHLPDGEAAVNKVLNGYRQAAKSRDLTWELTREDFRRLAAMDCFYCGIPPATTARTVSGEEFTYNGLDRVDSGGNYALENVVPCCPTCNHAKKDMPFHAFLAWVARLTEYHWFHPDVMPSAMLRAAAISRPPLSVVPDTGT